MKSLATITFPLTTMIAN